MYRSSTMGRRSGRILVMVAVMELALAAGFWFVLGDMAYAGDGMRLTATILGITGAVLLVVGLLLMRGAAKKDRISASGVAGTGQIMGVTQTGALINNQPQVELDLLVTIPGRSPYRAKVREIVPLIMLSRLQGTLPVRVDPTEPEAVVIQWDQPGIGSGDGAGATAFDARGVAAGAGTGDGPGFGGPGSSTDETLGQVAAAMAASGSHGAAPVFADASQGGYSVEQLRAWLRTNGISGTARIDRLDDSGQTVGDERLFTMTTTVSIPGRPAFTSGPSAAMVPLEKVGRVAVGVALPVKVAPDNQDVQMFEWDRI
jgi:hypothetical protein